MIQRIQTLYLFIGFVLAISGFFLNWVVYQVGEEAMALHPFTEAEGISASILTFFLATVVGIFVAALSQFKNRKQQMRSARLTIVLAVSLFLGFGADHYMNIQALKEGPAFTMHYGFGVAIPFLCAVLAWLAYKGIKKDDDLVRSVDRLR